MAWCIWRHEVYEILVVPDDSKGFSEQKFEIRIKNIMWACELVNFIKLVHYQGFILKTF